ncbi:MAG TPA: rhodanese-like domain-containing protein, partial [Armatimonadota bacterium]|nr:rhodanese-like domain-containing protein [Armatimonadota bacterium]
VPRNTPVVVHCKAGGRSRMAVDFLKQQGYTNLRNLAGGIDAWIRETTPE